MGDRRAQRRLHPALRQRALAASDEPGPGWSAIRRHLRRFSDERVGHGERDGSTGARLLHLNGTHWSAYHIPWQVQLRWLYSVTAGGGISPDGRGGFWIPTQSTSSPFWMLHFRAGKWSRVGLTSRVYRVAHIPGTTSLWGSGEILRKSSATGTIWAYGRLG